MHLTPDHIAQYRQDGYLVVEGLLTNEEADRFVSYEAEPKPEGWRGNLRHHVDNEAWRQVATHPNIAGVATQLLGGLPHIVQTMYLEKKPAGDRDLGGAGVALHQDFHYLPCDPNTLMACWCALSDTDPENGGLCVVPGSHKEGVFETRKNPNESEHDAWEIDYLMRDREGKEWVEHMYSFEIEGLDMDRLVKLTVPKGAGVFFDGLTIHGSYANRTKDRYRRAFATHFVHEDTWVYRVDVQSTVPAL
jgi:ectoine hydroxylase-related dioxygenase (phytanoyl-CoA dioxygenase family)